MAFTSLAFLLVFPLAVLLYYITPAKYRLYTLLVTSYIFYINVKPVYVLLLAGVTISTFIFTTLISRTENEHRKKAAMIANIILILLPLFYFKYFGAINDGMISLLKHYGLSWPMPQIKLFLPVGISFYTFMAIGYTIDVYNEEIEAEKNLATVALFISFFPLVLSGPIERAKNMLPQFQQFKLPAYNMIVRGMKLMLWGYFMKLVVANRIGIYVDAVYNTVHEQNGTSLLLATLLTPFQIYADLGGYSLIAIGTAQILGFKVIDNFKRPFFAISMADLWRRWHISLITWLTDYVYTPLVFAFRKYKMKGVVIALMITFLISGLWHAATLTFVVWGLMQGVYLATEALTNKKRIQFEKKYQLNNRRWYVILQILITFILFAASQVFGRADSIGSAITIYKKIFFQQGCLFIGDAPSILIYSFLGLLMLMIKDYTDEFIPSRFLLFENKNKSIRMLSYVTVVFFILLFGVFDGGQFLYFKF
jgi:D-alanyl-lipoteichoic acid acyltransferase DltB (MBOAT superfamily)